MHVLTNLQTTLATNCNQFRVLLRHLFPADNQPKSRNTVFPGGGGGDSAGPRRPATPPPPL